ncbi:MAG: glycosyltransferase family 4 protein [Candidatus Goldbacteria bacterium]|nr:glycosyltransferase family 4 protein [Candidatus Goldiibacteriota bacterium]
MKGKVCIAIDFFPFPGGAQSIVREIYKALATKYDVHFLTIAPPTFSKEYKIHKIGKPSSHYLPFNPCIFPFNLIYILLGILKLFYLQKKYKFKYILSQDGVFTGLYCSIVGKLTNTKVIIMDYGATTNYYSNEYWSPLIEKAHGNWRSVLALHTVFLRASSFVAIRLTAILADILMITGYELKQIYLNKLRVPTNKLRSYQYCVDTIFYKPLGKNEIKRRREELGIPNNAILINITCRLAPEKGIEYLMPALNRLIKEHANVFVIIIGGGILDHYILTFIKKNKLEDRIYLLGILNRNQVLKFLQISDIFVYSGISGSNVSLAVLEAMSCGCAVIATNSPKYHEELLNGNNGIVIPTRSAVAIYKALKLLINSPELMEKMKNEARKTVISKHSFSSFYNSLSFI